MDEKKKGFRDILNYSLIVMFFTHTLTHIFQRIHPAIYPELIQEFGLTNKDVGLIQSIPSLFSAVLSIPMGLLSDKMGSKKMIIISIGVAITGALIAGSAQNPWIFIVGLSLIFLNTTIYHPASYSFTTFLFEPKERSKVLGIFGAGGTLGFAIGPISLSLLGVLFAFTWRHVYLFWTVPLILGAVAVWFIKYVPSEDVEIQDESKATQGQSSTLLSTSLILFLVFGAIRTSAMSMTSTFLGIWLGEALGMGITYRGIVLGSTMLTGLIAAPLGGILAGRFGEKPWTLGSLIASYSCFALAFIVQGTIPFVIFYLGYGFFNLLSMAANSSIMAKLSPSKQRGLGFALFFLPGSIMGAVSPMVAAYIADAFGIFSVFMTSIAVFALALVVFQFGVKVD